MKITNPVVVRSWSVGKIVLILWLVISFYFVYTGVKDSIVTSVYKKGAQAGQNAAIVQLINQAQTDKCKPITVYAGEQSVNLIDISCIQNNATPAPAPASAE